MLMTTDGVLLRRLLPVPGGQQRVPHRRGAGQRLVDDFHAQAARPIERGDPACDPQRVGRQQKEQRLALPRRLRHRALQRDKHRLDLARHHRPDDHGGHLTAFHEHERDREALAFGHPQVGVIDLECRFATARHDGALQSRQRRQRRLLAQVQALDRLAGGVRQGLDDARRPQPRRVEQRDRAHVVVLARVSQVLAHGRCGRAGEEQILLMPVEHAAVFGHARVGALQHSGGRELGHRATGLQRHRNQLSKQRLQHSTLPHSMQQA
jgi:hypothetical protein